MTEDPRVPPGTTTIDIHCHVLSVEAEDLATPFFQPEVDPFFAFAGPASEAYNKQHFQEIRPKLIHPEERLRVMDRMGVDIQAISVAPPQYFYWAEPDLGAKLSRIENDNLARIVKGHPDRFVGLGTLPLQHMPSAMDELERIATDLKFPGLEICTSVNGLDFDDPRFEPFFRRVQELELLLVVHPHGFSHGERLGAYYLINTVGMPLDSTVFLSRLIFGGVLERSPDLKICVVHGGGYLPSYPARYDHAWRVRRDCREHIPKPPSWYLQKLYYDTMVFDPEDLRILIDRYGADHILMGTDFPYDMGEDDPIALLDAVVGLDEGQKQMILGANAARLLKLTTRPDDASVLRGTVAPA